MDFLQFPFFDKRDPCITTTIQLSDLIIANNYYTKITGTLLVSSGSMDYFQKKFILVLRISN
jgi:hypothetical protein